MMISGVDLILLVGFLINLGVGCQMNFQISRWIDRGGDPAQIPWLRGRIGIILLITCLWGPLTPISTIWTYDWSPYGVGIPIGLVISAIMIRSMGLIPGPGIPRW